MRSIPTGNFHRLAAADALWRAYLLCRQGKSRQPKMARFDLDADRHVIKLHRQLIQGQYACSPWSLRIIRDPKLRLIAAPTIRDRIVHRALLNEIGPHYERGFIDHSYTAGKARGPHRAVLCFQKWQRRYRFRLHLDIHRYFLSIDHGRLLALFGEKLKDLRTENLIQTLLTSGRLVYETPLAAKTLALNDHPLAPNKGLPLGSYFSQWSGTFYLNGLEHFVKRELKIKAYLRYMDDFVLFSDSREHLREVREEISRWLHRERLLQLNPDKLQICTNSEPAVFLGYRVSRSGLSPSRKLRRSMKKRIRSAAEKGHVHRAGRR